MTGRAPPHKPEFFGEPDMHIFFIPSIYYWYSTPYTHILRDAHISESTEAYLMAFFMSVLRSLHTETIDPNSVRQ